MAQQQRASGPNIYRPKICGKAFIKTWDETSMKSNPIDTEES
jgi:hypothetical protein